MTQARRFPRRDPLLLFRLQTDFAAGLAPAQIAEKPALSLYVVTQALLCDGRPGLESCQSSTRGLQVYIRDRNLGRLLVRWGIPGADRATEAVPVDFIPHGLVSHFVRGYIEGGRETPPFGGGRVPGSPKTVRRVVLAGPHDFLTALRASLPPELRRNGSVSTRATGMTK